ncbi:iron-responsive transcriptional regulator [Phycisphaerae bacterium RAS1]|nr:iron-responsive transcriptional regulator [Phycisphaerae bacterium RAS1]
MFSRTVEYALRAIVWMAMRPDAAQTAREIAGPTQVPAGYLSKVMQSLAEAGVVDSQRGLGGGFRLSKPPAKLTVLEVIQAVDPIERIASCPLQLQAHSGQLCPLHRRLDQAIAMIETVFRDCTISALLPGGSGATAVPLCADQKLVALGSGGRKARRKK